MSRRSVSAHRTAVAEAVGRCSEHTTVALRQAIGRVTATDLTARTPVPAFDNSAMDGFAVRAGDVDGQPLRVAGRVYAGDTSIAPLPPRAAVAIMTGAPIPAGADAVIPVEQSTERDGVVSFGTGTEPGAFIRRTGSDVEAGGLVVAAGTVVAPRHAAALAATGTDRVEVCRRPRVAVISTGSELVAPGNPTAQGQIYESNSVILAGLAQANGAEVVSVGSVGDGDGEFAAALQAAAAAADVVVTSGGVSMGEREPVRDLLAPRGWFGAVAVQPGGPQGLSVWDGVSVISLPGNPVSVMVSFEVFVRPALRAAAGLPPITAVRRPLADDITSIAGKTQFLRGAVGSDGAVSIVGGPGSHLVATAAAADVLVEIDAATAELAAGAEVPVWPMTQ